MPSQSFPTILSRVWKGRGVDVKFSRHSGKWSYRTRISPSPSRVVHLQNSFATLAHNEEYSPSRSLLFVRGNQRLRTLLFLSELRNVHHARNRAGKFVVVVSLLANLQRNDKLGERTTYTEQRREDERFSSTKTLGNNLTYITRDEIGTRRILSFLEIQNYFIIVNFFWKILINLRMKMFGLPMDYYEYRMVIFWQFCWIGSFLRRGLNRGIVEKYFILIVRFFCVTVRLWWIWSRFSEIHVTEGCCTLCGPLLYW